MSNQRHRNPSHRVERMRQRLRRGTVHVGWLLLIVSVHTVVLSPSRLCRPGESPKRHDAGSPTVETIGWVSFALVIVVLLGNILRAKLTTFANSLPISLNW
jgi:hypothetical protein